MVLLPCHVPSKDGIYLELAEQPDLIDPAAFEHLVQATLAKRNLPYCYLAKDDGSQKLICGPLKIAEARSLITYFNVDKPLHDYSVQQRRIAIHGKPY